MILLRAPFTASVPAMRQRRAFARCTKAQFCNLRPQVPANCLEPGGLPGSRYTSQLFPHAQQDWLLPRDGTGLRKEQWTRSIRSLLTRSVGSAGTSTSANRQITRMTLCPCNLGADPSRGTIEIIPVVPSPDGLRSPPRPVPRPNGDPACSHHMLSAMQGFCPYVGTK